MKPFHPKSAKVPTRGGPKQQLNARRRKRRGQPITSNRELLKNPNFQVHVKVLGPRRLINDMNGIVVPVSPNQETFLDVVKKVNPNVELTEERWIVEALRHKGEGAAKAEMTDKVSVIIQEFHRLQFKQQFNIYFKSVGYPALEGIWRETAASGSSARPENELPSSNIGAENGKSIKNALDAAAVVPNENMIIQPLERNFNGVPGTAEGEISAMGNFSGFEKSSCDQPQPSTSSFQKIDDSKGPEASSNQSPPEEMNGELDAAAIVPNENMIIQDPVHPEPQNFNESRGILEMATDWTNYVTKSLENEFHQRDGSEAAGASSNSSHSAHIYPDGIQIGLNGQIPIAAIVPNGYIMIPPPENPEEVINNPQQVYESPEVQLAASLWLNYFHTMSSLQHQHAATSRMNQQNDSEARDPAPILSHSIEEETDEK